MFWSKLVPWRIYLPFLIIPSYLTYITKFSKQKNKIKKKFKEKHSIKIFL